MLNLNEIYCVCGHLQAINSPTLEVCLSKKLFCLLTSVSLFLVITFMTRILVHVSLHNFTKSWN
jgi:hypothetical protein